MERALQQILFDNHLRTLRAIGIDLAGVAVFDQRSQLVWSEPADADARQAMRETLALLPDTTSAQTPDGVVSARLADGRMAHAARVEDGSAGGALRLVAKVAATDGPATTTGRLAAALQAVCANIATEYQLNRELEAMAGELAQRYDELNLAFQAESPTPEGMFGYDSLRRLVRDTTEFLGVAMACLMMPSRELRLFYQERSLEMPRLSDLLDELGSRFFDDLRRSREPIVINNRRDALREGLAQDIACKLLMVPVQGAGADVVGMLVIANSPEREDYTNSDRNLLEVMATKITKILQVNFDSLTGLENSHSFAWTVGQALQQSRNRGLEHAVLHIDVDRTGVVNDVSGREAGDELIRIVGKVLSARVRVQDTVARIAGDEFGVLLEICPLGAAAKLASDIARQIESTDFSWLGTLHPLSVCIGVAPITAESETAAAVLSAAEVACDAAKEKGRNRIQVYRPNDTELLQRRGEFRWVGRIQAALRQDRFELHAQLITPLRVDAGPPHYEVLVRMLDDDDTLVPPGAFIPAAEHYHLMAALDRWVVHQTAECLRQTTQSLGPAALQLSVNLSGQSLADDQTKAFVCQELERLGPLASDLCFEITESAAIASMEQAVDFIAVLKDFGCRVSLDDFGSGLSSFAYLQRFDVDFLKIDGSFVRRLGQDAVAESMVSAIDQVGKVMGLMTIAEFVESAEIDARLRAIGVDYGQGYHYHRPAPLRALLQGLYRTQEAAGG